VVEAPPREHDQAYGLKTADPDEGRLRASLAELLTAAAPADGSVRRGVGGGWLVELRLSRAKGSRLVAEGQVVHVAMI
jgi:hypothetical protein